MTKRFAHDLDLRLNRPSDAVDKAKAENRVLAFHKKSDVWFKDAFREMYIFANKNEQLFLLMKYYYTQNMVDTGFIRILDTRENPLDLSYPTYLDGIKYHIRTYLNFIDRNNIERTQTINAVIENNHVLLQKRSILEIRIIHYVSVTNIEKLIYEFDEIYNHVYNITAQKTQLLLDGANSPSNRMLPFTIIKIRINALVKHIISFIFVVLAHHIKEKYNKVMDKYEPFDTQIEALETRAHDRDLFANKIIEYVLTIQSIYEGRSDGQSLKDVLREHII